MLKRGNPFTPEPIADGKKKTREYTSPLIRTPLRNIAGSSQKGSLFQETHHQTTTTNATNTAVRTILNDDEEERRQNRTALGNAKRQLKKRLLSPAAAVPKANPPSILGPKGLVSPLVKGMMVGGSPLGGGGKGKSSPLVPTAMKSDVSGKLLIPPKLTTEQRNKTFEEWMKIAADNKINAKNSWNVALIDYFSELTFLRDGDSINFQKASCTLDGCVKIYATRVDSVADETGKLLNGLVDGGGKKSRQVAVDFFESVDDSLLTNQDDGVIVGNEQVKKTTRPSKRPHRTMDTLEKSFEALNLKNFELNFSIDPLFKKMCSEFDESNGGSTAGLLTCNLSLNSAGRLIFDSSEDKALEEGEEEEQDGEGNGKVIVETFNGQERNFISSLLGSSHGEQLLSLDDKTILPSLDDFSFGAPNLCNLDRQLSETIERLTAMTTNGMLNMDMESESDSDSEVNDSGDDDNMESLSLGKKSENQIVPPNDDDNYNDDEFKVYDEPPPPPPMGMNQWNDNNSIKIVNGHSIIPAMASIESSQETLSFDSNTTNSFLKYFDEKIQRNWAGPEHWKVQRPHLQRVMTTTTTGGTNNVITTCIETKSRGNRKEFVLDFFAEPVDISTILVKANPVSITLSKSVLDERSERNYLLPEDLHFSSSELLGLFIKPSSLVMIGKRSPLTTSSPLPPASPYHQPSKPDNNRPDLELNEVEPSYWAHPTNTQKIATDSNNIFVPLDDDDGLHLEEDGHHTNDDDAPSPPIAANHSLITLDGKSSSNGLPPTATILTKELVPTFRPAIPVALNYARRAKRVDIQELKKALWDGIEKVAPQSSSTRKTKDYGDTISFQKLIASLEGAPNLPKDMLKDISVPYCFICLLHLVNENNLELKSTLTEDLLVSYA